MFGRCSFHNLFVSSDCAAGVLPVRICFEALKASIVCCCRPFSCFVFVLKLIPLLSLFSVSFASPLRFSPAAATHRWLEPAAQNKNPLYALGHSVSRHTR